MESSLICLCISLYYSCSAVAYCSSKAIDRWWVSNDLFESVEAVGKPLTPAEFMVCVLKGLKTKFSELVTSLSLRTDPISFFDLLGLVQNHEFLHSPNLPVVHPNNPPAPPMVNFVNWQPIRGCGRGRGRGRDRGRFNATPRPLNNSSFQPPPPRSRC